MGSDELLRELAGHLEAAAAVARRLADRESPSPGVEPHVSAAAWVAYARELHPALGERQAEVLDEVAKVHPEGTGTGPIWRAINYDQTNTYLTLDALTRHGLVRKDASVKPHRYYLGPKLIRHASQRSSG